MCGIVVAMRLAVVASAVLCLGMPGAAEQRAPRLNLAIDGNSLSIAVNGVPAYATYLPFTSTNVALGGQTTRDMIESFGDVQAAFDPAARNILVAWEGTNDLYVGTWPSAEAGGSPRRSPGPVTPCSLAADRSPLCPCYASLR